MIRNLSALQPYAIGLLRIVTGLLYFEHGTQKLFSYPIPGPETLSALSLASGLLEVIGGALIVLGLFTRPVAFILSGHMAFAYWMVHAPNGFFPVGNGGDAAIMFCFVFLTLVTTGSGAFSLDNRQGR
ncbi:DoxX family protein [Paracoccus methylovorus]|uniref:DoxX family protein n=1 Tax=Paracoccus methylovorus TaxID=2812658 RepID=A0ABX7JHR9_9RHOB|nr:MULTISPECIES: DoxX family protein [Paracoccus]QRZ12928.1 DoxX family protein [Paracoccus methylovorus]